MTDTPRPVPAPALEQAALSTECQRQSPLSIELQPRSNGISVLITEGEIDISNAHRIHDAVLILAQSPQPTHVELDVGAVTSIDSSGLSALIKAAAIVRDRDGDLTLRNPSAPVAQLLKVTGLTENLLEAEPSEADSHRDAVGFVTTTGPPPTGA